MSRLVTLSYYNIKRLARQRRLLLVLYALPLVAALARVIFAKSQALLIGAWICPFVCAILVWAVLHVQKSIDRASGLDAGLRNTPLTDSSLVWACVLTGAIVFTGQMIVFGVIVGVFI